MLFRTIRLFRVFRITRHHSFKELASMVQAAMVGIRSLWWSLVLFGLAVYVFALTFMNILGPGAARIGESHNMTEYHFSSVPRAMFTVLRCSFGDCTDYEGVPLFAQGSITVRMLYCVFMFVVTIGLFNIISAVFVER